MSEPSAPERIYLWQIHSDGLGGQWDRGRGVSTDIEYLRADAARELIASEIEAEARREEKLGYAADPPDNGYSDGLYSAARWLHRPTPTETTTK